MVRYLTADAGPTRDIPETTSEDVTGLIPAAVDEVLRMAESWIGWNGIAVTGDGNVWTPHKALRRVTDHLVDHLAEIEARRTGYPTVPDRWHGRQLTLDSDWARFTEADLDEATSRLGRLALCYRARLSELDDATLDEQDGTSWTIRQVVHHVANVTFYARQLG